MGAVTVTDFLVSVCALAALISPAEVTVMVPVAKSAGIATLRDVVVAAKGIADTFPVKLMLLFAAVGWNPVPVITRLSPA